MESNKPILEAIALKTCLSAVYNKTRFRLAPYILYTRHDELYIDGVALERDGMPPREVKLGTFKVAGLSEVAVDPTPFRADPVYNPYEPRYEGTTLFALARD
ncbi:MAG: hypothetical protein RIS52_1326 [Pseudomonadota bacterium]|jgi:hypothetical protein